MGGGREREKERDTDRQTDRQTEYNVISAGGSAPKHFIQKTKQLEVCFPNKAKT